MKTWVAVAICAIGIACVILTLGSRNGPPRSLKEEFDERADRWVASCERRWPQSTRESYCRNEEFRSLVELGPDIIPFIFEWWFERQSRIDSDCMDMLMKSVTGVSLPPVMVPVREHITATGAVRLEITHDPYREAWWEWYQTTRKD